MPITVAGESTSTLVATPQSGAAPLIVRFSLPGAVPDTVSLDFDGNGTIDFAGAGLDTRTFLYAAPGVYVPTATAVGPNGQPASVSTVVQVSDPAALDGVLIAKWRAMRDALRVGDIAEAVTRIVADARDDYRAAFQAIAPRLPAIDTILTDIALVEIGDGSALYEAVRTDDGLVKVFDVRFAIDDDGVWRVEGF